MAKLPPKLSGLVRMGAVVASTPVYALPDMPVREDGNETGDSVESSLLSDSNSAFSTGRNIQSIFVHLIDPNPLAPREVYTPEMISSRAEDLRSQGQHDPIHVIPNPAAAGRYLICDGWTRVQACIQHKVFDSLLAEIHSDLSLEESAWFGYEQNECRAMHCDLDRAMFYEKLLAAGESAAEIAQRAKLSKTMMSFYRAYAKLPVEVMEIILLNPGRFGATVAYQLHKLQERCGTRKAVAVASKFGAEDQTVRWLTNQVQSLTSPTIAKPVAPLKQVRYSNGFLKQRDDLFEVSITVPDDKREAFSLALEKLLETVAEELPVAANPQ